MVKKLSNIILLGVHHDIKSILEAFYNNCVFSRYFLCKIELKCMLIQVKVERQEWEDD